MVSAKGAMKFDHAAYRKMAEDDAAYSLLDFKFSKMEVIFPTQDVAVLTYQVDQKAEMKGKQMDAKMSASSTWVKSGDSWLCVIHTESPMSA
jgi:ketosteroid isomerase-like protein